MTNEERRAARYERRVLARKKKREDRLSEYDDFDKVFSYEHLYESYRRCRRNVMWKASVQKFAASAPVKVRLIYNRLHDGSYKQGKPNEFDINERGKTRHISSILIGERVVQRCLCDYCLTPILGNSLIYDNGASTLGKGVTFAINRLEKHLKEFIKAHGTNGYIMVYDFKKYFDNIDHDVAKQILIDHIYDERILKLAFQLIDGFGDIGVGLGSQISQILALAVPNRLDHFCKEKLRIKYYGRYMDDGYLIHESKEYLQECKKQMELVCKELGITLHPKKTQIIKLTHGFKFLQRKISINAFGDVIYRMPRESITRERRKLKKLAKMLNNGVVTPEEIRDAYQSWRAYALQYSNSARTIKTMDRLYQELVIDNWRNDQCITHYQSEAS